jgi:hypothetical protein
MQLVFADVKDGREVMLATMGNERWIVFVAIPPHKITVSARSEATLLYHTLDRSST